MLSRRTFLGYLGFLIPGILSNTGLIHLLEKINQYTGNKNGASQLRNHLIPEIKVIGVGSTGCTALNHIIKSDISNVDFVAIDSDLTILTESMAGNKIHIGMDKVCGVEIAMYTELAQKAIREKKQKITSILKDSKIVIIIAGLGCCTGTGAAYVLARLTNDYLNITTHSVVTLPFKFEGPRRMTRALNCLKNLQMYSHSVNVLPNQDILKFVDSKKTTISEAFQMSDERILMSTRKILNRYCMREDIT